MSDIISSFGLSYTFKRYGKPTSVKGQEVMPTEVLNNGQPWTMVASVQQLGFYESVNLPEGLRNKDVCKLYTQAIMQVPDERQGLLGDRFIHRGFTYEVTKVAAWQEGTDLPYNKYYIVKVEQG
jgi:hypothetical protein